MKHARKNPGTGAKPNYLVAALIGLPVGYYISAGDDLVEVARW